MKKRPVRNRISPLKDKPLRNPGQSLDEELDRLIGEEGLLWVSTIAFSISLFLLECWRWYTQSPPNPIAALIVVVPVTAFSLWKLFQIRQYALRLKMARDGERAVGQYLSDLREKGYRIFHDIVGDNFNVDHIIISDRGIFTVETKTYSKPSSGRAEIHFDGTTLSINGHNPHKDILTQAQAQADWSRRILKESTGRDYPVKAVVVFPGWFVKSTQKSQRTSLWVLNPKAIPSFIENERPKLKQEDVQLAAYHLSRYIRTKG